MVRRQVLLVAAAVLTAAACGQGSSVSPPRGDGLSGHVLGGAGTDGNFSGQPLPGVLVRYESEGEAATVTTAPDGYFNTGRPPRGPFTLHVLPEPAVAASRSVYTSSGTELGLRVRFYLPLRRPVGSPARGTGNRPVRAVTGTLLSPGGSAQPGAVAPGRTPGEPGTAGFVWWGAYRFQSSACPRCYSTVASPDGTFEIQGFLGGQTLGRTFPFFAGNYDGVSSDGLVAHHTAYAFLPAVDALSSRPADLGRVQLVPAGGVLPVHYDGTTVALASGYGQGGAVYTFLQMYTGPAADPLELAEAVNGPLPAGTVLPFQFIPVPQIPEAASRYFFATSFVLDVHARGLPEVAATLAFRIPGQPLRIGHLQPPRILRVYGPNRPTIFWAPSPGATVHVVTVLDASFSEVWTGILGAAGRAVTLPFDLPPGVYRAFVFASDALLPSDLVASGRLPSLLELVRDLGLPADWRKDVRALGDALRRTRAVPVASDRGQLLSAALASSRPVREAVSALEEFTVP